MFNEFQYCILITLHTITYERVVQIRDKNAQFAYYNAHEHVQNINQSSGYNMHYVCDFPREIAFMEIYGYFFFLVLIVIQ